MLKMNTQFGELKIDDNNNTIVSSEKLKDEILNKAEASDDKKEINIKVEG